MNDSFETFPLMQELVRSTHQGRVELKRSCVWLSGKDIDFNNLAVDQFQTFLQPSAEYAAFFLRALIGKVERPQGWLQWDQHKLVSDRKELIAAIQSADIERVYGADLVARICLTIAFIARKQSASCTLLPSLDGGIDHPDADSSCGCKLRFLSADFAEGRVVGVNHDLDSGHWFEYPDPPFVHFGWRMPSERRYAMHHTLRQLTAGEIVTFLAYPEFFQHAEASFAFRCPDKEANSRSWFLDGTPMVQHVTKPYVAAKMEEFESRSDKATASLSICLGIPSQKSASYDPQTQKAGYGVFLTADIECPNGSCTVDPERLEQALAKHCLPLRYIVLQSLAGKLLREALARNAELQKYETMYNLLRRPLRGLTRAIAKAEQDAYEVSSVLYAPLDIFLSRQPAIAVLFEQGSIVKVPYQKRPVRISHTPAEYENYDAIAVAAELIRRLMPRIKFTKDSSDAGTLRAGLNELGTQWGGVGAPYQDFSRALYNFFDPGYWKAPGDQSTAGAGHKQSWEGLAKYDDDNLNVVARELLCVAKDLFFTLYKPDEASEALKWGMLRAYLRTIKKAEGEFLNPPEILASPIVLGEGVNPLATHGHIVDFVSRVVAQHCAYNGRRGVQLDLVFSEEKKKLQIASTCKWIPENAESGKESFVCFLVKQSAMRRRGARSTNQFGDLKRPFVDLIQRVPEGFEPKITKTESPPSLAIQIGGVAFEFTGSTFTICGARQ
ncbi:MAG: hypothetical protein ACT4PZ_11255 [Panacagrimonas sp.]